MGAIYGLQDPRTGEVRYVGRTKKDVVRRVASHLRSARRRAAPSRKEAWLRELEERGLEPLTCVLEEAEDNALPVAERAWIARSLSSGAALVNTSSVRP